MALRVSVKFGKDTKDLELEPTATLGQLRTAIEQQMSVPKALKGHEK